MAVSSPRVLSGREEQKTRKLSRDPLLSASVGLSSVAVIPSSVCAWCNPLSRPSVGRPALAARHFELAALVCGPAGEPAGPHTSAVPGSPVAIAVCVGVGPRRSVVHGRAVPARHPRVGVPPVALDLFVLPPLD